MVLWVRAPLTSNYLIFQITSELHNSDIRVHVLSCPVKFVQCTLPILAYQLNPYLLYGRAT